MSDLQLGRWMERETMERERLTRRVAVIEATLEMWTATARQYGKRSLIIVAACALTAVAASFPDTTISKYAATVSHSLTRR
jgi:hypothetical protein